MKALHEHNRTLWREVWRRAIGACLAVDAFKRSRDPRLLQEIQDELALGLLKVERRLQILGARQRNGRTRVAGRIKRSPALKQILGPHQSLLVERDAILKRERSLLRQIGDAVAWLVLRNDPQVIASLWAEGRTHFLPQGVGLEAPMQVVRELNNSGEFFAIFNDLTRCLGVGDLTVVPRVGPWSSPLSMELKAKWLDDSESEAEIDFLSPHSDQPAFSDLFANVRSCLGLKNRTGSRLDRRAQRQIDELLERTDLIFRLEARLASRLTSVESLLVVTVRFPLLPPEEAGSGSLAPHLTFGHPPRLMGE